MHPPLPLPSGTIRPRRRESKRLEAGSASEHRPFAAPPFKAELLTATGLHWVLQLRGDVETVIEYDARRPGVELVKVDSRVVCREGTLLGYNGHFSFTLPGNTAPRRVELKVRNSLWSAVTEFRLEIDGETLFVCETAVETCSLPVPAKSPSANRAELPLPHPR